MTDATPHRRYRFSTFVLDTRRGALLEDDTEVALRPQSLLVLQYLLQHHGRLVSKEELHDAVWGQRAVTDDSLAQCLVEIRRALRDKDRTVIRTLPRRGYAFEASVDVERPDGGGPRASANALRGAAILGLVLAALLGWMIWSDSGGQPSVAVLPFDDLSAEQNLQHIGDGLAEDILNSLAHYQELSVIARTSSAAYATGANDIKTIATALNVEFVVEGSVRETIDGNYRVVAQLIESDAGTHVWSEAFEIQIDELPDVLEQISYAVRLQIAPDTTEDDARAAVPGYTSDQLILLARDSERALRDLNEVDPTLLATTIQLYRDATNINPGSALAQAGLARVLLIEGDIQSAKLAVEAALDADDSHTDVQEVYGRYLWLTGRPGAGEAWAKALELSPNNVDALGSYGYWIWMHGGIDEAEAYLSKALNLDPLSLSRFADYGNYLGNEARNDQVLELVDLIQQRFDSAESYRVTAHLLTTLGQIEQGIAWLALARSKDPENPIYSWALAELFADIGDYETAVRLDPGPGLGILLKMGSYPEFIEQAEDQLLEGSADLALHYSLAFAYNATGEHARAIYLLDRVGVREFVAPEIRQTLDLAAIYTWIDSMFADGRGDEAGAAVQNLQNIFPRPAPNFNWWRTFNGACLSSALGSRELALDHLTTISRSHQLPFLYLVRDAHCMQELADDSRHAAVIADIERRQEAYRKAVPATLARVGAELPELVAEK